MALNPYFSKRGVPSEHNLYHSIMKESIQIKGLNVIYLPRTLTKEDKIFGEDTLSEFNAAYEIEAYMETTSGPEGDGDIMGKFGLEIRDETTFTISKKRWEEVIGSHNDTIVKGRPNEGDLIYLRIDDYQREFYEISFVEHEDPFYQLEEIFAYKLKCSMFEFSNEKFNTGIPEIDSLHDKTSFDGKNYEIINEDGSSIIQENGGLMLQDDWVMENAQREYAINQEFLDKAAAITVAPKNPFNFE